MVEAGGGDNFGDTTVKYLRRIREGDGFMIAACTKNYAEVTSSPFSAFEELKFAINHRVDYVLILGSLYSPMGLNVR